MARTALDLLTMAAFECLPRRVKYWLIACRHGGCVCPYHRDPLTRLL